jgi:hypothetical protein
MVRKAHEIAAQKEGLASSPERGGVCACVCGCVRRTGGASFEAEHVRVWSMPSKWSLPSIGAGLRVAVVLLRLRAALSFKGKGTKG